jgi:hypothetical protein
LRGFSNHMRITKVILVGLPEKLGVDRRHLPHVVVEGAFPCLPLSRSGMPADWRAAPPPSHVTTSAAARLHRADRGPRRETSSC